MRFSIFLGIFFTAKKSIFNAKNENSENSESSENSENSQKNLTAMGSYSCVILSPNRVLFTFLYFIYTECVPALLFTKLSIREYFALYLLAMHYQLYGLGLIAERQLRLLTTIYNVVPILQLASNYFMTK